MDIENTIDAIYLANNIGFSSIHTEVQLYDKIYDMMTESCVFGYIGNIDGSRFKKLATTSTGIEPTT